MTQPVAPRADVRPHRLHAHGETRIDPYYWLRDDERTDPDVLAYLQAENDYTTAVMAPLTTLRHRLYREMRRRMPTRPQSLPWTLRGWCYQDEYQQGAEQPTSWRWPQSDPAARQCVIDAEARAAGHDYYELAGWQVCPQDRLLAFAEDTVGRRDYTLRVLALADGSLLADCLQHCDPGVVWLPAGDAFFYASQDATTLQANQVWLHRLGTPQSADTLIFTLHDDELYLSLEESRSGDWLIIQLQGTLRSEAWLVSRHDPLAPAQCFAPAVDGLEYQLDHFAGCYWLRANHQAANFGLYTCAQPGDAWQAVWAPQTEVLLEGFELFDSALLVAIRRDGLTCLQQYTLSGAWVREVQILEPVYTCWLGYNPEPSAREVRYGYCSLTTPDTLLTLDLASGVQTERWQRTVRGPFSPQDYRCERRWITARDGSAVPVSLVWRASALPLAQRPLLLQAYGAYGASSEPDFSSTRLSLLDRGFIVAIAHVRGGEELGRHWYDQGRGQHKINTFHDFIDVTQGLLAGGCGDARRVFAWGGSAGGLLIGAVLNMAPSLYCGMVAAVPFVDVLTTMQDPEIPLTTGEYDEWGNPAASADDYRAIRAWSPYDQVSAQAIPHLLVTTGLHDSQVQYWEPAKWVAKLRATRTNANWLLLSTDLQSGHGGASGRYRYLHEVAREYAFFLHLAGVDVRREMAGSGVQ